MEKVEILNLGYGGGLMLTGGRRRGRTAYSFSLQMGTLTQIYIHTYIVLVLSPPIESGSGVSSGIKWFQPPPDRSCGGSNRGPPYQVQRQSPLNQLTIGT
jgi:hypothetical protein